MATNADCTYHGTEHPSLEGCKVRVVGIFRKRRDVPSRGHYLLSTPEAVARADYLTAEEAAEGVSHDTRVAVQPWIGCESRFSFVWYAALARDLDGFANLL